MKLCTNINHYRPPSDNVQRKRTVTLPTFFMESGPDKSIVRLPGKSKKIGGQVNYFLTFPEKCIRYIGKNQRNSVFCSRKVDQILICQSLWNYAPVIFFL